MLHDAKDPPPFYPDDFKAVAHEILEDVLSLSVSDITPSNCRDIYIKLVELFS